MIESLWNFRLISNGTMERFVMIVYGNRVVQVRDKSLIIGQCGENNRKHLRLLQTSMNTLHCLFIVRLIYLLSGVITP